MSREPSRWLGDAILAHVVLASAAAELAIREGYHRAAAEPARVVLLAVGYLVVLALLAASRKLTAEPGRRRLQRSGVILAVGAAVYTLFGYALATLLVGLPAVVRQGLIGALVCAGLMAAAWAWRLGEASWARWSRAIATACVVFASSPVIYSMIHAPRFEWPPVSDGSPGPRRTATLFLLLDEMNASSAAPLVDVLRARGLDVASRAIATVGYSTGKVVPEMFSGQRFDEAKPCSLTAICSASQVLDFGRITASRPDIDVVGFFHPYCAIQGLRWCERVAIRSALLDPERWRCAIWRRTGLPTDLPPAKCRGRYSHFWEALIRDTIDALWRAPIWREGGLLFAHLPLPHPPGADPGGSLDSHYRHNLERAARLLDAMLVRARDADMELRVVIFSDHPLRQAQWCSDYDAYVDMGCKPEPALHDERVPLIVAGKRLPNLDDITSNAQVFRLAARWGGVKP